MKTVICSVLTILAMVIIVLGFLVLLGSIIVSMGWIIILAITLFASGGPAAAVFAQSWPVLLISFVAGVIGFLFISFGYFLLWIGSIICSSSGTSGASSAFSGPSLSGLFPFPGIFGGFDNSFKGLDPGSLFSGLFNLLLLPIDQRSKLPPNILEMLDCFKKCLCKYICNSGSSIPDLGRNPGDVIIDTGKELLDDLKAQLKEAKEKLDELRKKIPPAPVDVLAYWANKIKELTKKIADLD